MKIEIEKTTMRNFFSFGDVETALEFKKGVNGFVGFTPSTKRSNGSGKCLVGNNKLYNPLTSEVLTIEELYNRKDITFSVLGLSDDLKLNPIEVIDVFKSGEKECIKIIFDDGSAVEVSKTHPILQIIWIVKKQMI